MRQAAPAVTLCLCFCISLASPARGGNGGTPANDTIDRARRLNEAKDYGSAATILEDLLIEAPARERPAIFGVLKQSYEALARQAEAAGRDREAAHYRDNLAILNKSASPRDGAREEKPRVRAPEKPRVSAPAKPPVKAPESAPVIAPEKLPAKAPEASRQQAPVKQMTSQPPDKDRERDKAKTAASRVASGRAAEEPARLAEPPVVAKPALPTRPSSEPSSDEPAQRVRNIVEGDRLFSTKQYDEAGRCYASLARENRLPANRTNHWAYCRMVAVATRMNARPQTDTEWSEIESEIQSIQRLAPKLWYGEYLRSRLVEARKSQPRAQAKNENLVVRGSAPDEKEDGERRFPRLFGKPRANSPASNEVGLAERSPAPAAPAAAAAPAWNGEWKVHESPNFLIFHADARLAEEAAEAAESVRAAQAKRWGITDSPGAWPARCEIYLYPDGKAFAKATSQPESSPGFSTIESDGKQITNRKVHLRADQSGLVTAILPHEVTHVVVADLFAAQQIPRWADEGIAVLAEPEVEQKLRAADLRESLSAGQVFELRTLMSTDTPEAKDWSVYYAQSVSITRFLVEQGTPAQLIQFVREAGRKGAEAALRDVYHIDGFAELQKQWQAYAQQQLAANE